MKRILVFILIILTLSALGGCSKKDEPEPDEPPVVEVPQTPTPKPAPAPTPTPTPTPTPEPEVLNPLNGLPLDEAYLPRRPVAVMYNILKPALPVFGITRADLIYEALAEGGITRVVGLFANISEVPKIGTIRSTRAYYLDMAQGHDALLMHVGYSEEARLLIASRGLYTLNGLSGTFTFYYRDQERVRTAGLEHSLFANGPDIEKFLVEKASGRITYNDGYNPNSLLFAENAAPGGGVSAKSVSVRFSSYKTGVFEYDEADGMYAVSQYGAPFIDGENGVQLRVKNVIVLYTSVRNTGDSEGHLITAMTGTGSGTYISGGKAEEIAWSKAGPDDPYIYTLADGSPLTLTAGVSYINIVPLNTRVTIE